jgi:meiotic recombination protein REC8, fungi type
LRCFSFSFSHAFKDWDEYLNIGGSFVIFYRSPSNAMSFTEKAEDETEFQPKKRKRLIHDSHLENARANLHTLDESAEQFLSASFDASFLSSSGGAWDPSFMPPDGGFNFDDNPFAGDDLDIGGGIGEELAKELGEGWGALALNNEQL